jgi:hypothetical protein
LRFDRPVPRHRLYSFHGLRTTFTQPSSLSRKVLYMPGPSSRSTRCVTTNDGSICRCTSPAPCHRSGRSGVRPQPKATRYPMMKMRGRFTGAVAATMRQQFACSAFSSRASILSASSAMQRLARRYRASGGLGQLRCRARPGTLLLAKDNGDIHLTRKDRGGHNCGITRNGQHQDELACVQPTERTDISQ